MPSESSAVLPMPPSPFTAQVVLSLLPSPSSHLNLLLVRTLLACQWVDAPLRYALGRQPPVLQRLPGWGRHSSVCSMVRATCV